MRNRANTPPRDENAFINGGTAGLGNTISKSDAPVTKERSKAKPVSISFAAENLQSIDQCIKGEMNGSGIRVNRSDIVRAAVMAFERMGTGERAEFIKNAKLQ